MGYPELRPRRLRRSETIRRLVRETRVGVDDLMLPLFVVPGTGIQTEVSSMPGVYRQSVDRAVERAVEARDAGIPAVLLFGIPEKKDAFGCDAALDDGMVQRAARAMKKVAPDLLIVTDVCLCEYTDHGHCGVLTGEEVANDETLELLVAEALSHAEAGADIIAPSDMMDGRVGAIRTALDEAGHDQVAILSYAAKYCSAFYGPFRDAADSTPQFGDRRGYQMDPANGEEAILEVALDLEEGADMVMVKPALPYLDVIRRIKDTFGRPTAAYQVSGEYSMIKNAASAGLIDGERAMWETLTSIRRAGADIIITYFALEAARALGRKA
ncbi:MAG: porphobilinogen synthase [Candidatus Binatia bacterium]